MSTLALPRHSARTPRRKPLSQQMEIGITAVLVVIGMVLSILSLSYLFYANATASQDYHLRVLQQERAELFRQKEVLSMEIAQFEALATLQENEKIASMVAAENPLYILENRAVAQAPSDTKTE